MAPLNLIHLALASWSAAAVTPLWNAVVYLTPMLFSRAKVVRKRRRAPRAAALHDLAAQGAVHGREFEMANDN